MNYVNGERLASKLTMTMKRGDVFRHEVAGAGGWGDPLERDPERVLKDVLEEKLTADYARREYGVVIDSAGRTVLAEETARLRAQLRAAAGAVPRQGPGP